MVVLLLLLATFLALFAWAVGDINPVYGSTTSNTGGINSLGSSTTWVAGYEWFNVNVGGMSPIPSTVRVNGTIRVGTTPTSGTEIRLYLVASNDNATWPSPFAGTAAARTINSEGVRDGYAFLARTIRVDSATSGRDYNFEFDAAAVFGGSLPKSFSVFVTHNTGQPLDATAGNQKYSYTPQYDHIS